MEDLREDRASERKLWKHPENQPASKLHFTEFNLESLLFEQPFKPKPSRVWLARKAGPASLDSWQTKMMSCMILEEKCDLPFQDRLNRILSGTAGV